LSKTPYILHIVYFSYKQNFQLRCHHYFVPGYGINMFSNTISLLYVGSWTLSDR